MHRVRQAVVAALVVLASARSAGATLLFADHFDACVAPEAYRWSTVSATAPTVSAVVDSDVGNRCSYHFNAPSGTPVYLVPAGVPASPVSTLYAGARVRCDSVPTTRRKVVAFRGSGQSLGMITVEPAPYPHALDQMVFRAMFNSADTVANQGECAQSSTMNGTECGASCSTNADCVTYARADAQCASGQCVNECDQINAGEAQCQPGVFAASQSVPIGAWYEVALGEVNGTGAVALTLYEGTGGQTPLVYGRGGQTRSQGKCVGGTTAGKVCATSADCGGAATCNTSAVVAIDTVEFGTDDTVAAASDCYLDEVWVDDAQVRQNVRMEPLGPDAEGTTVNWANHGTGNGCAASPNRWECVRDGFDGAMPDGDAGYLEQHAVNNDVLDVSLASPAATPTPAPTPIGVTIDVLAKRKDSGGATLAIQAYDGSGFTTDASPYNVVNFADSGPSAAYHLMPARLYPANASGGAWTLTQLNALQAHLTKGSVANEVRVTSILGGVVWQLANPAVPTKLLDVAGGGDGVTLCVTGDSTAKVTTIYDGLVGNVLQPVNIYDCARGGATPEDIKRSIVGIAAGSSAQFMQCNAVKGTLGRPCDVILVHIGVNALHTAPAMPDGPATMDGINRAGYCDDNGGSNEGGACYCPQVAHYESDTRMRCTGGTNAGAACAVSSECPSASCSLDAAHGRGLCRTKKSGEFLKSCVVTSDCGCSANADCKTKPSDSGRCVAGQCADGVCLGGTNAGALCVLSSECPSGTCFTNAVVANASSPAYWCLWGACKGAPGCPNGLCVAGNADTRVEQTYREIAALLAAQPGPPRVIWSFPPTGRVGAGLAAWKDIELRVGRLRHFLAHWSGAPYFVDMWARFRRECPDALAASGAGTCLQDDIHPTSDVGVRVMVDLWTECLTLPATSDGVCDGTSHLCTAGRTPDACSANADCDTWRCAP